MKRKTEMMSVMAAVFILLLLQSMIVIATSVDDDLIMPSTNTANVSEDLAVKLAMNKLEIEKTLKMYPSLMNSKIREPVLCVNSNGTPSLYKVPLEEDNLTVGIIYVSAKKFGPPIVGMDIFLEPSDELVKSEVFDIGMPVEKLKEFSRGVYKTNISTMYSKADLNSAAMNMWNISVLNVESKDNYTLSMPTATWNYKILSVPHQGWNAGCTPTAITMILKYHGAGCVLEQEVANAIGTDAEGNTSNIYFLTGRVTSGTEQVAANHGITVDSWTVWITLPTGLYWDYVTEINNYRPSGIHNLIGWSGATSRHSVAGEGYKYSGWVDRYYIVDDPSEANNPREWSYWTCLETCHTNTKLLSPIQLEIDIKNPTQASPTFAGSHNNPNPIRVEIDIKRDGVLLPCYDWTNKDAYIIKIGGKPASFAVFTLTPGKYLLSVLPPKQNSEGLYDLEISFLDKASDTEEEAVIYTAGPVEKGLHWLQTQQNPDGSWQNSVGITSMTALAFLNADYTEDDPTVNKAIQYILANKNADRSFGRATYDTASEYNLTNRSADRSFGGGTYDTSLAVLALVATHNSDYNDEIADAKDWLLTAQYDGGDGIDPTNPYYGGWSYGLEPSWADLSNTQFALMALEAAYSHLGLEKPKPDDPDGWASKAIKFISRCQNRPTSNDQAWAHDDTKPSYNDGGFIYCPEWGFAPEFGETESYGSITAAAIWSLRLCDVGVSDGRVQAGLNWLANNEDCGFDDNPGHPYSQEHCFLYYYYMSLAKALVMCFEDDLICDDWYTALSTKLIDLQHDDGYWINTAASHGQENIPEIATDFAILALQTKQPPAADLWMSVIIASNATLTVYDPQGRYARLGDITIPGATFEIDGDGRQIVNLTELEAGKYRIELKGTADGDYSLTIEGYRDEEKTSSEAFESTIKEGEYQKSDVLVTSMVGALTIIAEEPKDLLVTDLPNVELVLADPTVTSINVTGLSLSEIDTTYKPAEIAPQLAYMINSTGAGSFTLRFSDILDASAIIVYKINTTNQWIEILDMTTTANTVTFTMEVGDPPVVFGFEGLPPIANANGPYSDVIEYIAVPITFDGTGSYDPDGTIVSYEWDLNDDGVFDDAVGATPTVSFTAPYSGNINLKVTDNNGATDTDTTTLTISEPPSVEQPQYFKEKSSVQGIGYVAIDKKVQDWNAAIDVEEHMKGFGEFSMDSKEILNESARRSDPTDPNYINQKLINFQGNNTNRLTSFAKYESPAFYGGTGAKVRESFNVSEIQKQEFASIKTNSALGTAQSLDFETMDDFSGIWGIHSEWKKICQKDIRHHQMFMGNFSVQKDLTFEREIIMP